MGWEAALETLQCRSERKFWPTSMQTACPLPSNSSSCNKLSSLEVLHRFRMAFQVLIKTAYSNSNHSSAVKLKRKGWMTLCILLTLEGISVQVDSRIGCRRLLLPRYTVKVVELQVASFSSTSTTDRRPLLMAFQTRSTSKCRAKSSLTHFNTSKTSLLVVVQTRTEKWICLCNHAKQTTVATSDWVNSTVTRTTPIFPTYTMRL